MEVACLSPRFTFGARQDAFGHGSLLWLLALLFPYGARFPSLCSHCVCEWMLVVQMKKKKTKKTNTKVDKKAKKKKDGKTHIAPKSSTVLRRYSRSVRVSLWIGGKRHGVRTYYVSSIRAEYRA